MSSKNVGRIAIALLGAGACTANGHYVPDRKHDLVIDPEWSPRPVSPAERLTDPPRPFAVGSRPFDYHALPLLAGAGDRNDRARIVLPRTVSDAPFHIEPELPAEAEVGKFRGFNFVTGSAPGPFDAPSRTTDVSSLPCIVAGSTGTVVVRGVERAKWTDDSVEFRVYRGDLDSRSCAANLTLSEVVTAPAVIVGVVYAFRTCSKGCSDESDPGREEELVLVGPPSAWVATSASPERQTERHTGSFTIASVPVKRGSSASVLMSADNRRIAYFVGLRGELPGWASILAPDMVTTLTVEVTWPAAADRADGLAYALSARPPASRP